MCKFIVKKDIEHVQSIDHDTLSRNVQELIDPDLPLNARKTTGIASTAGLG
jgi:hypothetical protein